MADEVAEALDRASTHVKALKASAVKQTLMALIDAVSALYPTLEAPEPEEPADAIP